MGVEDDGRLFGYMFYRALSEKVEKANEQDCMCGPVVDNGRAGFGSHVDWTADIGI